MSIQVKFFASLKERVGHSSVELETNKVKTVGDAWHAVVGTASPETNILVAVNMEYVDASHPVKDGDEIAFFPPVTGG